MTPETHSEIIFDILNGNHGRIMQVTGWEILMVHFMSSFFAGMRLQKTLILIESIGKRDDEMNRILLTTSGRKTRIRGLLKMGCLVQG